MLDQARHGGTCLLVRIRADCLGANLARLEGRVALEELVYRWIDWDVDYDRMK